MARSRRPLPYWIERDAGFTFEHEREAGFTLEGV
jgi:hypothetical protein